MCTCIYVNTIYYFIVVLFYVYTILILNVLSDLLVVQSSQQNNLPDNSSPNEISNFENGSTKNILSNV